MEDKLSYTRTQLKAALNDFIASLNLNIEEYSEQVKDTLKNGQVQKFEFTIKLLWKTIKVFLNAVHGIEVRSPKDAIRHFFELEYCSYEESEILLEAIDSRNTLSHVYKKEQFEKVYTDILGYRETLKLWSSDRYTSGGFI